MRCDICYTPIPIGSRVCPNCGYTMPTNKGIHSSTFVEYNDHPDTFDHIQPVRKKTTLNGESFNDRFSAKARTMALTAGIIAGLFALVAIHVIINLLFF